MKELPQYLAELNSPATMNLSTRELEIIQLIAEGKNTKEIASFLDKSVMIVETHRMNIMRKLNVKSVAEVVNYAIRNALTSRLH